MEKPVELTEAEIDALVNAIGDVCSHTGPVVPSLPWGCPDCDETVRTYLAGTIERIIAAREAAARREALLGVRNSVAFIRTPLDNCVGLSRAQAFHVGVGEVVTLLDNALAEPERDEPCSDVTRVDHAADHYAMTGRDNYRCERDKKIGR